MVKYRSAKLLHLIYKVMSLEAILDESLDNLRKPQLPESERFVPTEMIPNDTNDSEFGLSPDEALARKEEDEARERNGEDAEEMVA